MRHAEEERCVFTVGNIWSSVEGKSRGSRVKIEGREKKLSVESKSRGSRVKAE